MATVAKAYKAESGSDGSSPSAEVRYKIFEAGSLQVAMDALYDASPSTFDLYGDTTIVLPKAGISVEEVDFGAGIWEGVVTYAVQARQSAALPGSPPEYAGDANGGTQKILRGVDNRARYPSQLTQPTMLPAPNQNGYIGVTKSGIEGVDVPVPGFNWQETHYMPSASVSWDMLNSIAAKRGTVNSGEFRGFGYHEVLFLDFAWRYRGGANGDYELVFSFSQIPSQELFLVGDIEVTLGKRGQEYLWVAFEEETASEEVDGQQKEIDVVRRPSAVYIEQVYQESDFSELGIGTGAPTLP